MNAYELNFHRDPTIFRVNEMPSHAYFIPFAEERQSREAREASPFFHSLNGAWRFLWKKSLWDLPDVLIPRLPEEACEVCVPHTWQADGFDTAQYMTSPYPFLVDPPRVPEKNPAALYEKKFNLTPQKGKRYELCFEGKDACAYVFLNGAFLGYTETPHSTASFDATEQLLAGENTLRVLMLKWCSGSYLDDQDKIRLSGLFRDVYLLERAEKGVEDFFLNATQEGEVTLSVAASSPVQVKIADGDAVLYEGAPEGGKLTLTVPSPRLWSAEDPYLYHLYLFCEGEVIHRAFGFRTCCVKDGVFLINGRPVKLYGVNRHDSHPETGYVVSVAHQKQDLLMMKRHNVNALRCAHYPNDPRLYEMCDEIGLYVMCEADLESHGFLYVKDWNRILTEPSYAEAVRDRVMRMYAAHHNSTCIVIWSLGNESGWGPSLAAAARELKEKDPSRPIHYESVFRQLSVESPQEQKEEVASLLDFYSRMYMPLEEFRSYESDPLCTGSILLCEYSHAMGNSCGDLRFYDEIIQSSPRYSGGFIWEWCDHSLWCEDEKGERYLGYGGDFGEKLHRRNFCMDGTVSPLREAHSNLIEAKAVFAPIRIVEKDGELLITNRRDFLDLSDLALRYELRRDGTLLDEGPLSWRAAAGQTVAYPFPVEKKDYGEKTVLTVYVETREASLWAEAGHEIAAFFFELVGTEKKSSPPAGTLCTREERGVITVSGQTASGQTFAYGFRRDEALICSMTVDGKSLLSSPLSLNCARAPLDNDNPLSLTTGIAFPWETHSNFGNLFYTEASLVGMELCAEKELVTLTGELRFGGQGRCAVFCGRLRIEIYPDGTLRLHQQGQIHPELPYFLPRYGYLFPWAEPVEDVSYFGLGPRECYEDKCTHALLGRHAYVPDAEMPEKPQESGSHAHTRELNFTVKGVPLRLQGHFSFCISSYSVKDTAVARHKKDLHPEKGSLLFADWRMSGVGSHSCGGQNPVPSCRINGGDAVDFDLVLSLF